MRYRQIYADIHGYMRYRQIYAEVYGYMNAVEISDRKPNPDSNPD